MLQIRENVDVICNIESGNPETHQEDAILGFDLSDDGYLSDVSENKASSLISYKRSLPLTYFFSSFVGHRW